MLISIGRGEQILHYFPLKQTVGPSIWSVIAAERSVDVHIHLHHNNARRLKWGLRGSVGGLVVGGIVFGL